MRTITANVRLEHIANCMLCFAQRFELDCQIDKPMPSAKADKKRDDEADAFEL